MATQRAAALAGLDLKNGEHLGLLLHDDPALLVYALAAFACGAIAVPLAADLDERTLRHTLTGHSVRLLVTSDLKSVHAKAVSLLQSGCIDRVIVVPQTSQVASGAAIRLRLLGANRFARTPPDQAASFVRESDLLRDAATRVSSNGRSLRPAAADDVAFAPMIRPDTASSTPALTHAALAANIDQMLAALPPLALGSERILAAVPLSDPLAFNIVTGLALSRTAETIIPENLTPAALTRSLNRCRPTVVIAAPALLAETLAEPRLQRPALADLKFTLTLGPRPSQRMIDGYKAATLAPLLLGLCLDQAVAAIAEPRSARLGEGYRGLAGTCFAVRDLADTSREVPCGERGVLYVSGPQIARRSRGESFLNTGQVGVVGTTGHIAVVDAISDLIVASGYMIYPSRIENALIEHPGVTDAAVIGVSEGRRGQAPKAFVILKRGMSVTERDLRSHLSTRISKIEMPADIDFCSALPRTPYGVVDKDALRREEAQRRR